jgi:hypothetical protein
VIEIHWWALAKLLIGLTLVLIGANSDAWWSNYLVGAVVGFLTPSVATYHRRRNSQPSTTLAP